MDTVRLSVTSADIDAIKCKAALTEVDLSGVWLAAHVTVKHTEALAITMVEANHDPFAALAESSCCTDMRPAEEPKYQG